MRTVLSENASITGRPAIVFTENKDPERESSTEKSLPAAPSTVNKLDPDDAMDSAPLIADDPVMFAPPWSTKRPFLTLNSCGIFYTVFTVQQLLINIVGLVYFNPNLDF